MKNNFLIKIENKKAEITSSQIITIVLTLVGFGLILLMYSVLAPGETSDREVCHASVIARATLPENFGGKAKEAFPLRCKTRKVCFTTKILGKGDCEDTLGNSFDTVRVSSNKDKIEEDIQKFLAREIADCWGMMGEGKVQVFSREATFSEDSKKCVVCSRIAFDENVQKKISSVTGLGNYLMTHKVPNKEISYWSYITGGLTTGGYKPKQDVFSTSEQRAIVFVEYGKDTGPLWVGATSLGAAGAVGGLKLGALAGGSIGTLVLPGPGTFVGGAVGAVGGAIVGIIGGSWADEIPQMFNDKLKKAKYGAGNFFISYEKGEVSKLQCDSFENIA